jgi:Zn-dependent peptidase ImmA (M78 family)/transcriptional regulator with XRE-family HTH domain
MKGKVPLNPDTLKWARESINMPIEEVALRMKKDTAVIEEWEDGASTPTYIQLETLAYDVYKRPIAVFFFPKPPAEATPKKSFRTLPESELEQLPPQFLRLFKRAQAMQANLEELNDGVNPAEKKIFRDLSFSPSSNVSVMVRTVREYLGIGIDRQIHWKDTEKALKEWRKSLEVNGIFVFKDAFRLDEISGFCLYHEEFPIIYLNNSMPWTRQVFTLFHELIHLILRTGGIDKENDTFIRQIHGDNRKIEILCNRFVGEFLVPAKDLARQLKSIQIEDKVVVDLADRYKVSREVILRRCLDRGLIDQKYYEDKRLEGIGKAQRKRAGATGGNYYFNQATYLGDSYLGLAFRKYYQNRFPIQQLAEYLNVKVNHIPDLEAVFLGRGTA